MTSARSRDTSVDTLDGQRAIEVTTLFDDTVLDVRHLSDPRGGAITRVTKALLGLGGGALAGAALLFFATMAHALSGNGVGFDIAVSLLISCGVIALYAGGSRLFDERAPRDFTIGSDAQSTFQIPGELVPHDRFALVQSNGDDYDVCLLPAMSGALYSDGKSFPLAGLGARHRLAPDARMRIELGKNTFFISSVPTPRRYPYSLHIDWRREAPTLLFGGTIFLFLGMLYSVPPDPKSLALDAFVQDQRFAKFVLTPPDQKITAEWMKSRGVDSGGGRGQRARGETGRAGKPSAAQKTGVYALRGPANNQDIHLSRQLADDAAQQAGVLGILKSQEGSVIAAEFSRDSAIGNQEKNVMGGLIGTQIGEAYGTGGANVVGTGKGGGGDGDQTIGLDRLGTIGKGGGGGPATGYGRNVGGPLRAHHTVDPITPGDVHVVGSLDKEIIRRVIRRHLAEVWFCYEAELLKKPNLYGRVMMEFTISGLGKVPTAAVAKSTLNDGTVEQCVGDAIRRWEFPKPEGGVVAVSYPFVFKAAD